MKLYSTIPYPTTKSKQPHNIKHPRVAQFHAVLHMNEVGDTQQPCQKHLLEITQNKNVEQYTHKINLRCSCQHMEESKPKSIG